MIICEKCCRDIDSIGQDNVSPFWGCPICEDCASEMTDADWRKIEIEAEE